MCSAMREHMAGPIPLTILRSAGHLKTTPFFLCAAILAAITLPIPGNKVRLSSLQVFMGKGVVRIIFFSFLSFPLFSVAYTDSANHKFSCQCPSEPTKSCCRIMRPPNIIRKASKIPKACRRGIIEDFSKGRSSLCATGILFRCSRNWLSSGLFDRPNCAGQWIYLHPLSEIPVLGPSG